MARLDAHGPHLYRPNGRSDSMAWQDMRSIRTMLRRAKHDPLTHFRLSDHSGANPLPAAGAAQLLRRAAFRPPPLTKCAHIRRAADFL
ncbi:hypothetical protein [Cardiobacterium valvarum]|uniref:Uncharacterized protein n=1 Tax=Cardiobacterium valvarum F0432 TaxID=797473 RepID=G9ZFJ4_9GAMM|nr:hypothetical protein [Cardiobacterium valvarum]EHM53883.1 hypothetical protein HMPREF9080_01539 [Cardiobacterium valvarum F0432]